MKKLITGFGLACALVVPGFAQVTAEVVLEQEHFLAGEKVPAAVRITNRSGQTLRLGEQTNWLTFVIEARDGLVVAKHEDMPVESPFHLESGKVATRRVELSPYFALDRVGRYRINANVYIPEWDRTIPATGKSFDIIKGARLWTQEFGMILPAGVSNRPPEVRRFTLEQANHLRSQLRLYLRITDASEGRVIKVTNIGSMISFSNPEPQLDQANQLHVLYQNGVRSYLYTVVNADGEILVQQTHEMTSSRPRLQSDDRGSFRVVGGARRLTLSDLPAPADPETNASPEKP